MICTTWASVMFSLKYNWIRWCSACAKTEIRDTGYIDTHSSMNHCCHIAKYCFWSTVNNWTSFSVAAVVATEGKAIKSNAWRALNAVTVMLPCITYTWIYHCVLLGLIGSISLIVLRCSNPESVVLLTLLTLLCAWGDEHTHSFLRTKTNESLPTNVDSLIFTSQRNMYLIQECCGLTYRIISPFHLWPCMHSSPLHLLFRCW